MGGPRRAAPLCQVFAGHVTIEFACKLTLSTAAAEVMLCPGNIPYGTGNRYLPHQYHHRRHSRRPVDPFMVPPRAGAEHALLDAGSVGDDRGRRLVRPAARTAALDRAVG